MAILATHVPVSVNATLIVPADPDEIFINLRIDSGDPVYLGGVDVSYGQGFKLTVDDGIMSIQLSPEEPLYARRQNAGSTTVMVLASAAG